MRIVNFNATSIIYKFDVFVSVTSFCGDTYSETGTDASNVTDSVGCDAVMIGGAVESPIFVVADARATDAALAAVLGICATSGVGR